jgi:hypothetical protein
MKPMYLTYFRKQNRR